MRFIILPSIFAIIISVISYLTIVENYNKVKMYPSDNPTERVVWEKIRLMDPATGQIPRNIHKKERTFAKTLPSVNFSNAKNISQANWVHRGPFNVGGRTRALAIDVTNAACWWLIFRVAHGILYIAGVTYLRTLAYFGSIGSLIDRKSVV